MNTNIEIDRSRKNYRLFELLPGLLTWSVFILPVFLSLYWPKLIASLVIIYAIYWLTKAIIMSIRLVMAYRNYKKNIVIDWLGIIKKDEFKKGLSETFHLVIAALSKEELETIWYTVKAVVDSEYPLDKVIFVLATEERYKENGQKCAVALKKEFGDKFYKFLVTEHPMNLPGEVKGKGSNITFAAKYAKEIIDKEKIDPKNVIVTTLDSDNRVHEKYLACVTYHYLTVKDPKHKSFQPLPMFFNNIWQVPIFIRSISVGGSFWQMIQTTRPDEMRNFSAHAQSLEALTETNFWSTKSIVEDGHQFWRSYFTFNGNHKIVPILVPVYQDAVLSPRGYLATAYEQYIQKRRWAWGCSDIPYVLTNIIGNKKLPFWDKWLQAFRLIEGHFSWSSTSIILAVVGWLPSILNKDFHSTVLAYNFPTVYSRILTVSMVGLVVTLIISTLLLPPNKNKKITWSVLLEWIISPFMLPASNIIFGSLVAIDAQTRLMFGRYLGYNITEKAPYYGEKLIK